MNYLLNCQFTETASLVISWTIMAYTHKLLNTY